MSREIEYLVLDEKDGLSKAVFFIEGGMTRFFSLQGNRFKKILTSLETCGKCHTVESVFSSDEKYEFFSRRYDGQLLLTPFIKGGFQYPCSVFESIDGVINKLQSSSIGIN